MPPPKLETRTPGQIYQEAVALARVLTPEWAEGFGPETDFFNRSDPGLAFFKLFADLYGQLSGPLNGIPNKYQLAFWDFTGLQLRAPKAAEAPITFQLKGLSPSTIAKHTKILSSSDKSVVFETLYDLEVLPATIVKAMAVRPQADAWCDRTDQINGQGAPFPLFADSADQTAAPHSLYLADSRFDTQGAPAQLTLCFEGVNLDTRYFGQWYDGSGASLTPVEVQQTFDQLYVTFNLPPAIPQTQVNGQDGLWLQVCPEDGVRILPFLTPSLPRIYTLNAQLDIAASPADTAFFNATKLDLKKGDRPFGTRPAIDDAFYINAATAFSKTNAEITLFFDLQPITPPEAAVLSWEYWNGAQWCTMAVEDETKALTVTGAVTFTCPPILETKINNVKGYWIRARLSAGGYGEPQGRMVTVTAEDVVNTVLAPYLTKPDEALAALKQDDLDFGYEFQPASYTPPFINRLDITASLVFGPDQQACRNGNQWSAMSDRPYAPLSDTEAVFYLGFSQDGFSESVAGTDLTLYLAFENEDPSLLPSDDLGNTAQTLGFEAWCGHQWVTVKASRQNPDVENDGVMRLAMPEQMTVASLFEEALYWIRIHPPQTSENRLSLVQGVFPNTVAAANAVQWQDVVLGSSTGAPGQSFDFPHTPVLSDIDVQVCEPTPGDGPEADWVWISWSEVSNFDFATPVDRCFTIDHNEGVLQFGDGEKGRLPPKGARNIRAHVYFSGGGQTGNRPKGDLNRFKHANTTIQSLHNVEAAVGGVDADTIQSLSNRAPGQVKSLGRAVTLDDFVALTLASSQQVLRATGAAPALQNIQIVVLPAYNGAQPLPTFELRDLVKDYLSDRCLPQTAGLLDIQGPDYLPVDCNVTASLQAGVSKDEALRALNQTFTAYLMPQSGGDEGQGWDFGSIVKASDLVIALAATPGITEISTLSLSKDRSYITCGWNQLPTAGLLTLEVDNADTV